MRKVILNLAVSLDGFIEGPNGEYDWCFTDQDYGMKGFIKQIDAIFFGRKSYELLLSTGSNAYPGKRKYVFSRTMKTTADKDTKLIEGDIKNSVKAIKSEPGKNIWLFGGASLTSSLLNAGLVDELQLAIHPIILGKGKPLFREIKERTNLKLMDAKTYSSGLVQLFYEL